MNKKMLNIFSIILLGAIFLIGMTGCGKKNPENDTNIKTEKINIIDDFAKYINNKEIGKVVVLFGINIDFYEINNIKRATEEDIRNIAEEYGTYESFVDTYKDYEQYVVDYKLSIDGSSVEAKDIFFIKEENGVYSLVTSKVWQGLISYNYMMYNIEIRVRLIFIFFLFSVTFFEKMLLCI